MSTNPRAPGSLLRIAFMPLGAAAPGGEMQRRRAGLGCPQPKSTAGVLTLGSMPKAVAVELRGDREIPNPSTNSGPSAPACEPACLPNVTVK